jgi:hypothetical protein
MQVADLDYPRRSLLFTTQHSLGPNDTRLGVDLPTQHIDGDDM